MVSYVPVWSLRGLEDGGVCAGVSACVANPAPYKPKSSALDELALLHFLPLLSPKEDNSLFSCPEDKADDKNLLSWLANDDKNLFSCCPASEDMNLFSCAWCDRWLLWCRWWSSISPDTPNSPPTRFGLSSSMILEFCPQPFPLKFNWRLKIAGKMLNCWGSPSVGSWGSGGAAAPPAPPAPPATQGTPLKSNVGPCGRCSHSFLTYQLMLASLRSLGGERRRRSQCHHKIRIRNECGRTALNHSNVTGPSSPRPRPTSNYQIIERINSSPSHRISNFQICAIDRSVQFNGTFARHRNMMMAKRLTTLNRYSHICRQLVRRARTAHARRATHTRANPPPTPEWNINTPQRQLYRAARWREGKVNSSLFVRVNTTTARG